MDKLCIRCKNKFNNSNSIMTGIIELFLFCGVLYYFFNIRANNMVDIVSTRLQEVYAKWEARTDVDRDNADNTPSLSLDGLRRAGQQTQRRRIQNREQVRRIRENSLFKIKESELFVPPATEMTSFICHCCQTCTPTSRGTFVSTATKQYQQFERNMFQIDPGPSLLSKIFSDIAFIYGRKSYDYPRVTQTVMNDERVKDAIKIATTETSKSEKISEDKALAQTQIRATSILSRMESCINHIIIAITGWFTCKLMPMFIRSIIVQHSQIEMIQKANERGVPLIFLPLHRSHIDYMCVGYFLLSINVRNCLVAAGNNLNIPIIGKLLSGLGAFYIKRQIDPVQGRKDILYRAILQAYVMESLRAGHNMEFFIEGGRTRTGKPRMPKAGILSIIVNSYKNGTIEDALIIPMSINYERLVDGNFVKEQLGQPKTVETFGSAIKAVWKTLRGNYGIVKCDFCEPFSLHEMIKSIESQQMRLQANKLTEKVPKFRPSKSISNSSLCSTDVIDDEYRLLVNNIARHVVYDSGKSTPIMSTNMVAFLLLNKFRNGCTLDELVKAFDLLRQELEYLNKNVAFCGETLDIINHAMKILGPGLVTTHQQEITQNLQGHIKKEIVIAIQPVSMLPNVIELSYYSNSMVVHYVLDSVVVSALYAALRTQLNDPRLIAENNITVFQSVLVEKALKLCDILKNEFIFCRPCEDLEHVIIMTIENLSYTGIISLCEETYLEEELWSRRYAKTFDDSSDEDYADKTTGKNIQYKMNLSADASARMEFLHIILRPLIDTYALSAFTLRKLVDRSLLEKDLLQEILSEIKTNIESGKVSYGESMSVDPIKNSFKLFERWQVLECHAEKNTKIYYLQDAYDDDVAATQIYELIEIYKWTKNLK